MVDAGKVFDPVAAMLASDVLVTDYSSIMFDYLELGRPIVLFLPDYEEYSGLARGGYFDLAQWAPGPIARTPDELWDLVFSAKEWSGAFAAARRAFGLEFGGREDGQASRRVVEEVFLNG
jgi:CDP-glycerol glycerophosphotransferase